jgi:hypothetical protein
VALKCHFERHQRQPAEPVEDEKPKRRTEERAETPTPVARPWGAGSVGYGFPDFATESYYPVSSHGRVYPQAEAAPEMAKSSSRRLKKREVGEDAKKSDEAVEMPPQQPAAMSPPTEEEPDNVEVVEVNYSNVLVAQDDEADPNVEVVGDHGADPNAEVVEVNYTNVLVAQDDEADPNVEVVEEGLQEERDRLKQQVRLERDGGGGGDSDDDVGERLQPMSLRKTLADNIRLFVGLLLAGALLLVLARVLFDLLS